MNNTYKKRIDDLGRIVLPKQIRTKFKLNSFDEIDIYVENGNIVIKKAIGILKFKDKFERFFSFISSFSDIAVVIFDNNNNIICYTDSYKKYNSELFNI